MTDPTDMPFQGDSDEPRESIYEGRRPEKDMGAQHGTDPAADGSAPRPGPSTTRLGLLADPEETETDILAARVAGPHDQEGMTALWRATMDLGHWWFVAVGEPGAESPAAAQIDDQLMLLTFTSAERARHFAVQNEMIGADEDLRAIALAPAEVVDSAQTYSEAGIGGLMFDPHLAGYFMPSEQLPVVWDALRGDVDTTPAAADGESDTGADAPRRSGS